jgi:hypothetical protein
MNRSLLVILVVAVAIGITAAQTGAAEHSNRTSELTGVQPRQFSISVSNSVRDGIGPQAFAGTWQGLWRRYRAATHTQKGSETSLSVTLSVKAAANGTLSGTVSTSDFQHQATPEPNPPLPLGAPPRPVAPPPPPLPAAPPPGMLLNPRIEERTLAFQVKDPDGEFVDFRLTLQAPNAGTLNVTRHSQVYPEFQMKRIR